MPKTNKNVLIIGSSAFAAKGLADLLSSRSHSVDQLVRSIKNSASPGSYVVGDIRRLENALCHKDSYDVVINYALLKDETVEKNLECLDAVINFLTSRKVKHYIHISSVSCYPGYTKNVSESAGIETEFRNKGKYGALKVACDQFLLSNIPNAIHLSLVRPGFILGEGLVDPIVGMGFRTPLNRLLLLGNAGNVVPVTTRDSLNNAIAKILEKATPERNLPAYLIVDSMSPTRKEFLEFLCKNAGYGSSTISFHPLFWKVASTGAGIFEKIIGTNFNARRILANAARKQSFDSSNTAEFLGIDLHVDWRAELLKSLQNQERNFSNKSTITSSEYKPKIASARTVGFIGFGRIVKQKYLPSLRKIDDKLQLIAYDVFESTNSEIRVLKLGDSQLAPADLYVVASPGPKHVDAIVPLNGHAGTVLVEKPLGYNHEDIGKWRDFAGGRDAPVFVCHNYRFKKNVLKMLSFLKECNPGKLLHADVWFQSPPVANDGASWLRDERNARTLLYDYSIHFLDAGCMFDHGVWRVDTLRYELNARGETSLICGQASSINYSVSFLLRQGAIPRRARIRYVFQNYDVHLEFFPETFSVSSSNPSAHLLRREAKELSKSSRQKVIDKLRGTDRDYSHLHVLQSCLNREKDNGLSVSSVSNFYNLLFEIGNRVYQS